MFWLWKKSAKSTTSSSFWLNISLVQKLSVKLEPGRMRRMTKCEVFRLYRRKCFMLHVHFAKSKNLPTPLVAGQTKCWTCQKGSNFACQPVVGAKIVKLREIRKCTSILGHAALKLDFYPLHTFLWIIMGREFFARLLTSVARKLWARWRCSSSTNVGLLIALLFLSLRRDCNEIVPPRLFDNLAKWSEAQAKKETEWGLKSPWTKLVNIG